MCVATSQQSSCFSFKPEKGYGACLLLLTISCLCINCSFVTLNSFQVTDQSIYLYVGVVVIGVLLL